MEGLKEKNVGLSRRSYLPAEQELLQAKRLGDAVHIGGVGAAEML